MKWPYRFPLIMLTVEVRTFGTQSNLFLNTCLYGRFVVLGTTLNHIPLKYRCLIKISNQNHTCSPYESWLLTTTLNMTFSV
jgi:hypothetical protein